MHSKRGLSLIALMLAMCLMLSGCALIQKDAAVDAATEIVKVAGKVFTKAQVQEQVNAYLAQMHEYYEANYGQHIDITEPSVVADAQDQVINALVRSTVLEQKETENGVLPLSDEAKAEVDAEYQKDYDLIKSVFFSGEDAASMTDLDARVEAYMAAYLGTTRTTLEQSKAQDLLKDIVVKDVAVTEEEITADFNEKVESAKASYASNLSAYGNAVMNGTGTIYYRPAGYRMIKQILVRFLAEDQTRMDQLQSLLDAQNSAVTTQRSALTTAGVTDAAEVENLLGQVQVTLGEMDFTAETLTDITAETTDTLAEDVAEDVKTAVRGLKTAQEMAARYESLLADATEQAYARIADRADEVLTKVGEGADWTELVAEYNDDPGMAAGAANAETGYPVCENMSGMDAAFTTAAMALEKVGDVSPKTRGMYGYYILKYESDVAEGPVDLADVREGISDALLTTKQDTFFNDTVDQWVKDAAAVIDRNALNN